MTDRLKPRSTPSERRSSRRHCRTRQTVAAVGFAAVLTLIACAAEQEWSEIKARIRNEFPQVPQMSVEELAARLEGENPPYLVDVREPEEYAVSHLPGAVHARGDELEERLEQLPPGRQVVLYCSVGYRSSAAAAALLEAGHSEVSNLEGSIFEWANSGHPVVRAGEPVAQVHPYDEDWGRLLDSSLHAYSSAGSPSAEAAETSTPER